MRTKASPTPSCPTWKRPYIAIMFVIEFEPISSKSATAHASWLKNQKCPTKVSHMEENLFYYKGISVFVVRYGSNTRFRPWLSSE